MNDYIFKNGDWQPCGDLIGWDDAKDDWPIVAERAGLQGEPSHTVGYTDGFRVDVYYRVLGRLFEPDKTITHLIVVTTNDDWTHYYCPGHHIMHKKFAELSIPSLAEYLSRELEFAIERRDANDSIQVEEIGA